MKKPAVRKRVLLVTPHTFPDYSGSGINAFYFARFLNQKDNIATILTFNRNLKLRRREHMYGVLIRRITYFNSNLLTKTLSLLIIIPAYLVYVIKSRIVILYGAHIVGYQFIIFICKLFGRKVIFRSLLLGSDDAATLFRGKSRISRSLYRNMFQQLDLYFSINPVFTERFRNLIGEGPKIITQPQGVDTESFKPDTEVNIKLLRDKYGIDHDTFLIMSVGFLINRKGFNEVFSALGEFDFNFRYILVGEYEFPKGHFLHSFNMEAEVIRQDGISILNDKLVLTGACDQMRDYYLMSDLVLINSKREGLPNTLLEAMACGKAVLIRDLPGISYIIQHKKNGIIYEDNFQMRTWLEKLYNEPVLREDLGKKARQSVEDSATFDRVWDNIKASLY